MVRWELAGNGASATAPAGCLPKDSVLMKSSVNPPGGLRGPEPVRRGSSVTT